MRDAGVAGETRAASGREADDWLDRLDQLCIILCRTNLDDGRRGDDLHPAAQIPQKHTQQECAAKSYHKHRR